MRKLLLVALFPLALSACNTTYSSATGSLAGAAGSAVAGKVAKSSAGTTALSIACANSAPILDRYAATAFPAAAPFIPAAENAFASFCQGALPNGTSTTAAAGIVNTAFAIVLGSGLMN